MGKSSRNLQPKPIDYQKLKQEIIRGARLAFLEFKSQRPGETFLAFGFDTDSDVVCLAPFAVTDEDLQRLAEQSGSERSAKLFEWGVQELPLWNPSASHLRKAQDIVNQYVFEDPAGHTDEAFIARKRALLNTFADALKGLDDEGVFGTGKERENVLVFIDNGDPGLDDLALYLFLARRLNSAKSYKKYERHIREAIELNGSTLEGELRGLQRAGLIDYP
jgi:hypothetical protein